MTREEAVEVLLSGDFYSDCQNCSNHGAINELHRVGGEYAWTITDCMVCHGRRLLKPEVRVAHELLGLPAPSDTFRVTSMMPIPKGVHHIRLVGGGGGSSSGGPHSTNSILVDSGAGGGSGGTVFGLPPTKPGGLTRS